MLSLILQNITKLTRWISTKHIQILTGLPILSVMSKLQKCTAGGQSHDLRNLLHVGMSLLTSISQSAQKPAPAQAEDTNDSQEGNVRANVSSQEVASIIERG